VALGMVETILDKYAGPTLGINMSASSRWVDFFWAAVLGRGVSRPGLG